jgi:hypothetical protein
LDDVVLIKLACYGLLGVYYSLMMLSWALLMKFEFWWVVFWGWICEWINPNEWLDLVVKAYRMRVRFWAFAMLDWYWIWVIVGLVSIELIAAQCWLLGMCMSCDLGWIPYLYGYVDYALVMGFDEIQI